MIKESEGEAIPFILINQRVENSKLTYQFELHRKAVDIFASIKHKKLAVAAVAGPQRSGKSFLSNRLLKRMSGFAIGPSTMPCTKGLWIWGEPIHINEDTVLIIIDTEGLNSVQRDINVDLKIFSLSILLSSVFIYNSLGHIDEKALENMSYVLRISENLRFKAENESDTEMSKCFPYFYWVLRDFSLDLKGLTENEYLENALKPISNDEKDPKNQIRTKIRRLFAHRRCDCFPRPINEEDKLAHIEKLQYDELRQKFREKMKQFERSFYENLPVKLINNKPLTGEIYINLCREYIQAINSGKIPEIMTSLERVLESEVRAVTENLLRSYKETMNNVTENDKAIDEILIERNHRDFIKQIEDVMDQRLKSWMDLSKIQQYKKKFMAVLEKDYSERLKKNEQLSTILCSNQFNKFTAEYYRPLEVKTIDSLTDTLVREKFQEFPKKIKDYMSNGKAPRKYTYFIEKFPKATFEYFDLFFAKTKAIFTNEINKLKADGRNFVAETESMKRIIVEHENLLLEKEKEINALCDSKNLMKRELEKIEKMKTFIQDTQNMNKDELKKKLQISKANELELQHRVELLEEDIIKLKSQLSLKRYQKEMIPKSLLPSAGEDSSSELNESVPNELVAVITALKDKIVSIKDFYDSKISQQTLDEDIISQIEQLRTEKHSSIEKIKEEYRLKMEEARKKMNKIKEDHEKNIELLNRHLDDIKAENIELQRKVSSIETPGKSFNSQRKMHEESLRLKQNNIYSLTALANEKQKQIQKLKDERDCVESALAIMKAEKANFQSYKETFSFILRESLNWVMNKNNKLKHSIRTLTPEDLSSIKAVFKELNLNPF